MLTMLGFEKIRQSGSHIFFRHKDGRTTLVPQHSREDIGKGLFHEILRDINMTVEEFSEYL